MAKTDIEWSDRVWNFLRGCSLESEGCRNCYAMQIAYRFSGKGQNYEGLAKRVNGHAAWTGKVRYIPEKVNEPLKVKKPSKWFVNSMSDLFHPQVRKEWLAPAMD